MLRAEERNVEGDEAGMVILDQPRGPQTMTCQPNLPAIFL